jgi:hypothetical protein
VLASSAALWLVPISVPGKNFQPFGCGSPAAAMNGRLAALVCGDALSEHRVAAAALLCAAIGLLAVSEVLLPRLAGIAMALWAGVASIAAFPLLAVSVAGLLAPLTGYGADGTQFRCGSALAPVLDPFARGVCGQLPETRKAASITVMVVALMLMGAAAYVGGAAGQASDKGRHALMDRSTPDSADGDSDGL